VQKREDGWTNGWERVRKNRVSYGIT